MAKPNRVRVPPKGQRRKQTSRAAAPREPVFVRHEPVLTEEYHEEPYYHVPRPYQFKVDKGWLFVMFCGLGGVVYPVLSVLAVFITVIRCWVWLCFKFPMTMYYVTALIGGMISPSRRRGW